MIKRIDAHQHFWRYHPVKDAWITDAMSAIQHDFLPPDLQPLLEKHDVGGCIAVQADQSEDDTLFLLDLAERYPFIKGVVGWVDLQAENVVERLDYFAQFPKLKGFRHILQGEDDPRFLMRPQFLRGVEALATHRFTYDILVKSDQLEETLEFVRHFPEQPFVIDHLAKPDIKAGEYQPWANYIAAIAQHNNVYCKLSGLVTEADWNHWDSVDFNYYIQHILQVFGLQRAMFGSDWPVCLVAANYGQVVNLLEHAIHGLTLAEREWVWHKNATGFYNI